MLVRAPRLHLLLACSLVLSVMPVALVADAGPAPFLPSWRLMSEAQRSQFIAGYLQGRRDASQVTDIAIEYIRERPNEAVSGLQKLKGLYDLSNLDPLAVSREVDLFYRDPANSSAGLSLALSFAKQRLTIPASTER